MKFSDFADVFTKANVPYGIAGLAGVDGLWRWTAHVGHPHLRIDYIWARGLAPGRVVRSFVVEDAVPAPAPATTAAGGLKLEQGS